MPQKSVSVPNWSQLFLLNLGKIFALFGINLFMFDAIDRKKGVFIFVLYGWCPYIFYMVDVSLFVVMPSRIRTFYHVSLHIFLIKLKFAYAVA